MLTVLRAYSQIFSFIHKNKIWSFYWLPIVFNSTLLVLLYYFLSSNLDSITSGIGSVFFEKDVGLSLWLVLVIKGLAYTLMLFYVYQPLSLIFLAPLFSLLSENVQDCINNRETNFNLNRFWSDVKRGVKIGVKNVVIQIPVLIILFFIGLFLPILAPFTLGASFLVTSYFYGFTMIDYRNEYYRLNPKESRAYVNLKLTQTLTIGAVFNVLLYIPVLGTIFGPSCALVASALSIDSE